MVLRDWLAFLKRTPVNFHSRRRRARSLLRRTTPSVNAETLESRTLLTYQVTYVANEFKIEQNTAGDASKLAFYEADPTHLVFKDPTVTFNIPTAITGVTGSGTNTLTLDLTQFSLPGTTSFIITTGDGNDSIKIGNNGVADVPFTNILPALNVDAGNDAGDTAGILSDVTLAANRDLSLKATNAALNAIALKSNVTTSGTGQQSYLGNVELQKNTTITANANVTFQGTVNSKVSQYNTLAIVTPGATWFQKDVGTAAANQALGGVKTNGGGVTKLGNAATITVKTTKSAANPPSTAEQTYSENVQLLGTTNLFALNAGNITLGGTVTGAFDLTTQTKGIADFEGALDIQSLTTQGEAGGNTGTTDLNGSTVKTVDKQAYGNNVLLTANTTLTSTNAGNVTFAGTVDSQTGKYFALTVNTAGNTLFQKNVGTTNTTALGSLNTDLDPANAGGNTQFGNAAAIVIRTNHAGTASGNQAWNDDVKLLGASTFIALNDGNITFDAKVDGNFDLLTQTKGIAAFEDAITVKTIKTQGEAGSTNGTTDLNGSTITTTGIQTYGNPVLLTADALLTSNNAGNISFLRTVDGPFNLTTVTDGAAIFTGIVGTVPLNSLTTRGKTTTATGTTQLNSGPITTATFQTYGNNVTLGTTETLTSNTAGNITFAGTVNGAKNLIVVTDGATIFNNPVGNATPLASLTTKGKTNATSGSTQLNGGPVTTTNFQTYDNLTLGVAATLTSNAAGTITFAGSIDGAADLKTVTDGTALFKGVIGTTPLNSLTTQGKTTLATGTTQFNGGPITTLNAQTYNNNALLSTNTALTSNLAGNITFGGTVNGAKSLTTTTDGTAIFNGVVGTTPLASLTTQGKTNPVSGTTQLNGGSVTTTGFQTYDNLTLGTNTVLTSTSSGKITFAGTVSGATRDLNTFTNGIVDFEGLVTLANVTVKGKTADNLGMTNLNGGTITTTGQQNYLNPVLLTKDALLTSNNAGNITFSRTISGPFNLTTVTDGAAIFNGIVGATPLNSLTTKGKTTNITGTTQLNGGSITTATFQTYSNNVTLGAAATLTSNTAGDITFGGTVNGAKNLVVVTDGNAIFNNAVGNTTPLASLTTQGKTNATSGTTQLNGGPITTTNFQTYDNVTLGTNALLTSNAAGNITFAGSVNGAQDLKTVTDGAAIFKGVVGTTPLNSLTTQGKSALTTGTTQLNGGPITTTTAQTYNNNVLLGANTALTSRNSGDIAFQGTVDSQANKFASLTVNTAGNTTFQKNVGMAAANQALGSLSTDVDPLNAGGTTRFAGAGITVKTSKAATTTGNQTYNDDVTLLADTTLIAVNKGEITFQKTVNGPFALITQTDGTTTFEDAVNIGKLTTQGATGTGTLGTTDLNGNTITTTDAQTYKNAVILTENTLLTSTGNKTIEFQGTVNGPYDLTTQTNGLAKFLKPVGNITPLANLTTQGNTAGAGETDLNGGTVRTTQRQSYLNNVLLGANNALTSTAGGTPSGDITFVGTVNSEASKYWTLTVNTGGTTWFQQSVGAGANQALGALTTDTPGTTQLGNGGAIAINTAKSSAPVTTGNQTFNDNLKLLANATLTAANLTATAPPNISFRGTVSGVTQNLTTVTSGTTSFHRDIELTNLTLNGQNASTSQVLLGDAGQITATLTGTMTIQGVQTVQGFNASSKAIIHHLGNTAVDAVFIQSAPLNAVVQDLDIQGDFDPNSSPTSAGRGIYVDASNLTLQRLNVHNLGGDGVEVNSARTGAKITQNLISNNGGIAIDLQGGEELSNGVTVNDKYQTTLSAQVPVFTNGTISVFDAWQFKTLPANFQIKIDSETMTVTAVNTDTNQLTVTRTAPQIHDAGVLVIPVAAPLADSDTAGANKLQNTPEILYSYLEDSTHLRVYYHIPSAFNDATHQFAVEFYLADEAGRGGTQLITASETYNAYTATGNPLVKSILLNVTDQVQLGKQILATATDSTGNTSEFSRATVVNLPPDQIGATGYLSVSGPAIPAPVNTAPNTTRVDESPFLNFAWDNTGGPNRPAAAYNNELGVFPVNVSSNGTVSDAAPGTLTPFRNTTDGNGGLYYTRLVAAVAAGATTITLPAGQLTPGLVPTSATVDNEVVTLSSLQSNDGVNMVFNLATPTTSAHAANANVSVQDSRLGAKMISYDEGQHLAFYLKHTVSPLNAPPYVENFYSVPQFNSDSLNGTGGQKINLHLNTNQGFDKDGNPYTNPSFPQLSHPNVNNPVRFRQSDGTLILPWEESRNAGDQDFNDAVISITDPWLRPLSPPTYQTYDTATPFATIDPGPAHYTGPNMLISDKNAPLSQQASIQGGDFSKNPGGLTPLDGGILIANIQVPATGITGDQIGFLTPAGYTYNSNVLSKAGVTIGTVDPSMGPTIFKITFTADATKDDAETVMRNLTYTRGNGSGVTRTIRFSLIDSSGATNGNLGARSISF